MRLALTQDVATQEYAVETITELLTVPVIQVSDILLHRLTLSTLMSITVDYIVLFSHVLMVLYNQVLEIKYVSNLW